MFLSGVSLPAADPPSKPSYIIEETPGKKKLNVAALDVQPTTTLSDLLVLFPELLTREGEVRLMNYDIQINGISTGVSGQNILYHLLAQDIDNISVKESPSMTEQVQGQGAVIDVIMKKLPEGLSGNVALAASTIMDVKPSVTINYSKNNFSLRSSVLLNYNHPFYNVSSESHDSVDGEHLITQHDTTNTHSGYELVRFQLDWKPTERGTLKAWLWESFTKKNEEIFTNDATPLIYKNKSSQDIGRFSMSAGAEYKHQFDKSLLTTKLSYSSNPFRDGFENQTYPSVMKFICEGKRTEGTISGFTKWASKLIDGDTKLELTPGINYDFGRANDYYHEEVVFEPENGIEMNTYGLYLSPYLEAKYDFSCLSLNAGFRYQYYLNHVNIEPKDYYERNRHDLTAFIKMGWQICPHHYLNLVVERDNKQPNLRQVYPLKYYDPSLHSYVQGNKDLLPTGRHNVSLNYIMDFTREEHDFVASATVQYIKNNDVVCTTYKEKCQYYSNDGQNDILSGNAMLYYHYGVLSVNLNGNFFHNWSVLQGTSDSYSHFNLSLVPVLSFRGDWRLTPKLLYYSKVDTYWSRLGDYFYSELDVSKTWGRWTVYMNLQDLSHRPVTDYKLEDKTLVSRDYNLRTPSILLGFVLKI